MHSAEVSVSSLEPFAFTLSLTVAASSHTHNIVCVCKERMLDVSKKVRNQTNI